MYFNKRWTDEFDRLLEDLSGLWGGEIERLSVRPDRDSFRATDPTLFTYPTLKTRFGHHQLAIVISPMPVGDHTFLDGYDGVEFLGVTLSAATSHDILIRHEQLGDKIRKGLGISEEFQTGNTEFDKRYFLAIKTRFSKSMLMSAGFQNALHSLEPFATVRVKPHKLCWSQQIIDKSQLELITVQEYVGHLTALLDVVRHYE